MRRLITKWNYERLLTSVKSSVDYAWTTTRSADGRAKAALDTVLNTLDIGIVDKWDVEDDVEEVEHMY